MSFSIVSFPPYSEWKSSPVLRCDKTSNTEKEVAQEAKQDISISTPTALCATNELVKYVLDFFLPSSITWKRRADTGELLDILDMETFLKRLVPCEAKIREECSNPNSNPGGKSKPGSNAKKSFTRYEGRRSSYHKILRRLKGALRSFGVERIQKCLEELGIVAPIVKTGKVEKRGHTGSKEGEEDGETQEKGEQEQVAKRQKVEPSTKRN